MTRRLVSALVVALWVATVITVWPLVWDWAVGVTLP